LPNSDGRFERVQALSSALDPIIDYCLAQGVHSAELESMVRVEFVRRAALTLPGSKRAKGKPSHEAIGLATGLNRGEVQSILASGHAGASLRMKKKWEKRTTSERVLALWEKNRRFISNAGAPLDLPLESQEDGPSFTELVQHALPGKLPRHVLKELRRRGVVEQLADEIIRYRPRTPTGALSGAVTTDALRYAADQQRLLGQTLIGAITHGELNGNFGTYAASEAVDLPIDKLSVTRASILKRMDSLTRGFQRDYGSQSKDSKSKRNPSVKVGICVFTWQQK
jgi:hypothetical protein